MKIFIIEGRMAGSNDPADWCEISAEENRESSVCFTTFEKAKEFIDVTCPPGIEARIVERDVGEVEVDFPNAPRTRH